MTERIVSFLDALVATVGAVDNRYCLVEKREQPNGDLLTDMPYDYVGNGNYRPVEVDGGSVSYWRLVSNISFDTVEGNTAVKNLQATYPIRYVAMLRRDEVNPLTFSEDVSNIINGRNKDLQTQLNARNVNIVVNSVETETPKIWREEFTVPVQEPNYTRSMVMIDLTVTVIAQRECWQNCDDYPDILQGFDWCGDTVQTVDRLTPTQQTCLSDYLCGTPASVTEQINGVTIGTSASGTTNNQLIQDSAGATVGTSANPSVVGDASVTINGDAVGSVVAEGSIDIPVNLDGSPSGSWDGDSWEVTSAPCADGDVENSDASYTATVASGGTLVLPDITFTDSDGSSSSVPSVQDITATPCVVTPTLSVTFSDDTPDLGGSVTITATATGVTPTSYTFYLPTISGVVETVTQASNTYVWTAEGNGVVEVLVHASDGVGGDAHGCSTITVDFPFIADDYATMSCAYSFFKAASAYSGDCLQVQRASDGAYLEVGWVNNCLCDFESLKSWAGVDEVKVTKWYDSTGNGNDLVQTISSIQLPISDFGGIQTFENGFTFRALSSLELTYGATNSPVGQATLDVYAKLSCTDFITGLYPLFNRRTNSHFMLLGQSGSTTTSINANFGSPTYYLDGVLQSWANRGAVYTSLYNTGVKQITTLGGDTTNVNWTIDFRIGTLDANTYTAGSRLMYWLWSVDTSANRTAIEAKMNALSNINIERCI